MYDSQGSKTDGDGEVCEYGWLWRKYMSSYIGGDASGHGEILGAIVET